MTLDSEGGNEGESRWGSAERSIPQDSLLGGILVDWQKKAVDPEFRWRKGLISSAAIDEERAARGGIIIRRLNS